MYVLGYLGHQKRVLNVFADLFIENNYFTFKYKHIELTADCIYFARSVSILFNRVIFEISID